jgi:SAM-dependent methyltransferase
MRSDRRVVRAHAQHLHPNYQYLLDCAGREAAGRSSFQILDYGCGRGEVVAAGRNEGLSFWGAETFYEGGSTRTDIEDSALLKEFVRELVDDTLPFETGSFDMVVTNQVLEHVEDLGGVLGELARVLRPEGTLIALFPSREVWREGHIGIPFAHRLRRTSWRHRYVSAMRRVGFGLFKADKSCSQWTRDALDWIDRYTHYRSRAEIERTLATHFDVTNSEPDYIERRMDGHLKVSVFNRLVPRAVASFTFRRLAGLVIHAKRKPI